MAPVLPLSAATPISRSISFVSARFSFCNALTLRFFTICLGVMPWASLYCICFVLRRSVSSMVSCIEAVMVSAYMITLPFTFLAARPAVCVRLR